MDRRTALKNISLASGYAIATPTILSVLQSCKSDVSTWSPIFLTHAQGHAIKHLVDIILPVSNIPGGLDVNIPEFIDVMYNDVEDEEKQNELLKGSEVFEAKFESIFSKKVSEGTKNDFESILETYFKITEEQQEAVFSLINKNISEVSQSELETYHIYKFLTAVRNYSLYGYYTSEKIGEEVLAYDPVPGPYIPCSSLEELTDGKAWSL